MSQSKCRAPQRGKMHAAGKDKHVGKAGVMELENALKLLGLTKPVL